LPRRLRPPLTAHEIAAYLCGGTAALDLEPESVTLAESARLADVAAREHAAVVAELGEAAWLYWFLAGMYHRWGMPIS